MKILLDECVPWPIQDLLTSHDCTSAQQRGWGGIKNGELLRRAAGEFDLFITSDQNIGYQQNQAQAQIAILELSSNDFRQLRTAITSIKSTITTIRPGEFRRLKIP